MKSREAVLAMLPTVPALPSAGIQFMEATRNPEAKVDDLVRILEYDPSLTSNLLRLVNSPLFAGNRPIHSVREALIRLGFSKVLQLALTAAFAPLGRRPVAGYDLPPGAILRNAIASALAVRELAKAAEVDEGDYIFTAALLHDIGKIVMGAFAAADVGAVAAAAAERNLPFDEAEREVLGIDHAEAGAELLKAWGLPGPIVAAVRWHHDPDRADPVCVGNDLVHLADQLTALVGIGAGVDGLQYRPSGGALSRLNIGPEAVEAAACNVLFQLEDFTMLASGLE